MAWDIVLPKFARALDKQGYLAIVEDIFLPSPWDKEVAAVLGHYSLNKRFQPYDMLTVVKELEARGLLELMGQQETAPAVFQQRVDDWLESFHARNGLSRERMGVAAAQACDDALQNVITRHCPDGVVTLKIVGRVIWGNPKSL